MRPLMRSGFDTAMFASLSLSPPTLIMAAVGLSVLVVQGVLISVLFRRLKGVNQALEAQQQQSQALLTQLNQQLDLLNRGAVGVGKRLMATEKRLNQTMERQEEIESKEWEQASYSQASRLIQKGVAVDDVVTKVGISRSEARLVDLLRRKTLETHD